MISFLITNLIWVSS